MDASPYPPRGKANTQILQERRGGKGGDKKAQLAKKTEFLENRDAVSLLSLLMR